METLNNNQQTTGLQIFNNSEIGAKIRATTERNETWFVAQDICDILNLKNPRKAIQSLDMDEKNDVTISYTPGGNQRVIPDNQGFMQTTTVINESGMYALIFGSKLPTAKAFKRWVTNEVLPSIRRTGGYSVRPAQHPTLPAPKYRPDFIKWKQAVCRYLNRNDLKTVATNMKVTYSHVCKVYSGNTMSRRIADRLTKLVISHKNKGIIYPEPVPVYRQLLIEWEEQG